MKELLRIGRMAMLYIRVISGYELRRIRSDRLLLEHRLQLARRKREASKRIHEQILLSEYRRMIEGMQNLNESLEGIEMKINKYFEPIDMSAEAIINLQLERERSRVQLLSVVCRQAYHEKAELEMAADVNKAKALISQHDTANVSTMNKLM